MYFFHIYDKMPMLKRVGGNAHCMCKKVEGKIPTLKSGRGETKQTSQNYCCLPISITVNASSSKHTKIPKFIKKYAVALLLNTPQ